MASKRRNMFQKNKTQETTENDPRVRASMKDRWNKVKDACKCETHKNCECCVGHEFKIPIVGSYNFKVCTMVGVNPDAKTVNFKVKLGPIKVYEKDVSYVKMDEVCKKFEKYKHLEFCMRMTVTENENNGLRGCVTLQANIMDIFNKPLYFPCLNFKNNKLTMDTNMDDYQDDGVRINLKALWKKFKGLFSKDKKQ
ncbi:hypothetical protein AAG570_011657 [Ranatra chinensis]|uniref:DUF4773 domain-containing protein n=1 Tax=Ranatra chinensis TaxID=642074 RepID=A0ABD0Z4U4_9HEMI